MQVTPWKFCSSRVHDHSVYIGPSHDWEMGSIVFCLFNVSVFQRIPGDVSPHLKCWMWALLTHTFSLQNTYSTPAASDTKKTFGFCKRSKKNVAFSLQKKHNQIDDCVITFIQPHTLLNSSRTTFCRNDEMIEFQNLFIMHHRGDISLNNGRLERRKYLIHFIFYLLFLSVDSLKGSSEKGHKS